MTNRVKTETQPPAGILCTHGLCFTPVYFVPSGLNALWLVVFCYANPSFLMRISFMIYASFYFIPTFSGMQLGWKIYCIYINILYLHKYKKRIFCCSVIWKMEGHLTIIHKVKKFSMWVFSWQLTVVKEGSCPKKICDDQHNCSVTNRPKIIGTESHSSCEDVKVTNLVVIYNVIIWISVMCPFKTCPQRAK
jgi:hypothetical protein